MPVERTRQTLLSPYTFWHNEVPKESGTHCSYAVCFRAKPSKGMVQTTTCCCHFSPTHVNKTKNEQAGTALSHLFSKAPYVVKELSSLHVLRRNYLFCVFLVALQMSAIPCPTHVFCAQLLQQSWLQWIFLSSLNDFLVPPKENWHFSQSDVSRTRWAQGELLWWGERLWTKQGPYLATQLLCSVPLPFASPGFAEQTTHQNFSFPTRGAPCLQVPVTFMIPFQLSPVDTWKSVRKAIPKFSKVAWRLMPSQGFSSLHTAKQGEHNTQGRTRYPPWDQQCEPEDLR